MDKTLKNGDELLILKNPPHTVHDKIRLDTLIKLSYIKLVTIPRVIRIILHITADIRQQVMYSPTFDAGRCGTDKTPFQVFVHNRHDSMGSNAVLHIEDLDTAQLAAFENFTLPVTSDAKSPVRYLT